MPRATSDEFSQSGDDGVVGEIRQSRRAALSDGQINGEVTVLTKMWTMDWYESSPGQPERKTMEIVHTRVK